MNEKTRKVVAKEVLLAFSIFGVLLITFLGIFIFNSVQGTKAVNIREKAYAIEKPLDSIHAEIRKIDGLPPLELLKRNKELLEKKDSLMKEHYSYHNSKFDLDESMDFSKIIVFIALTVLYPVRGMYLLIKWAVLTLKK